MSATVWSPNPAMVTQANAAGTLKYEPFIASDKQRTFNLSSFAYAMGTNSLFIFVNGHLLMPGSDYTEITTTQVVLANQCTAGDEVVFVGFIGVTGTVTVDAILRSNLLAATGAGLVGYNAGIAGAATRTLLTKLTDTLNVKDFGAVGDGVTDDTAAIQAAINSASVYANTVWMPPGNFRIASPLKLLKGVILKGASKFGTYLTTPAGSVFDMLRMSAQMGIVNGICFKPSTAAQIAIRIYAGRCVVTDNYFLAPVNNSGVAIYLADTDPDSAAFIPGAYTHTINENIIGDSGYAFANGIYDISTQGITSCKFRSNRIISNRPIQINTGGANSYSENLFQSSSGAVGATSGIGITLGANVSGEKIWGNYFENYQAMIQTANVSTTYQIFNAFGNHNDANNTTVADAGSKNYIFEDSTSKVENRNGWSTQYTSATSWQLKTPGAINGIGVSGTGNVALGAAPGASHIMNRNTSTEADVVLNLQYNTSSMGYIQDARGTGINGANTGLALNKNTTTNRSINAAGTVNASGADYAEYMLKADTCGVIAKGQIVGINSEGKLTDKWAEAITFIVKSTDPSYVGGDSWATSIGSRPIESSYPEDLNQEQLQESKLAFKLMFDSWEAKFEALRATVDRVAFAGQVPVNVTDFSVGDYIIAVQEGNGIKGVAVKPSAINITQYFAAVGKVIATEVDGRARIIVKTV